MLTDFSDPCIKCTEEVCPGSSDCPTANAEGLESLLIPGCSLPIPDTKKVENKLELPEKVKLIFAEASIQTPTKVGKTIINIKRIDNILLITIGKSNIGTFIRNYHGRFCGEIDLHYRAGNLIKIVSKKDR